jgi:hypothetical protein
MTSDALPDFVSMTAEEMDEWIAAEEAKTPFTAFNLGTDEGRRALLHKYYRIGDTSLFEAVSHVWASLNEPKADYCTLIGSAAGTGGKGKRGLVLALQKFLHEALEAITWIPPRNDFSSLDEWHAASMRTFTDEEEKLAKLMDRYSKVLNAGTESPSGPRTATIIRGPWEIIPQAE